MAAIFHQEELFAMKENLKLSRHEGCCEKHLVGRPVPEGHSARRPVLAVIGILVIATVVALGLFLKDSTLLEMAAESHSKDADHKVRLRFKSHDFER